MQLEEWAGTSPAHRGLLSQLQEPGQLQRLLNEFHKIDPEAAYIKWKLQRRHTPKLGTRIQMMCFMRKWGWAAASVILLVSATIFFVVFYGRDATAPHSSKINAANISPGRDGAVLTLADGSRIVLDSLSSGPVAIQNGSQAALRNGELVYNVSGTAVGDIVYNTMSTPKGRQFSLLLPDGTRVWLNAASSIRYPTLFTGKEREVQLTGEAYFEVAKNAKMPFRLKANGKTVIEVLGTSFNVNAYENEEIVNTTLLEGSVRVNGTTIIPGQQAQVVVTAAKSQTPFAVRLVNNADLDKVMAWKNGLFNFNDVSLKEVMRQLERWYDIKVVYEKGVPDITFWGKITKDLPLDGVLKALEKSEVHFKIEGRTLIVLP